MSKSGMKTASGALQSAPELHLERPNISDIDVTQSREELRKELVDRLSSHYQEGRKVIANYISNNPFLAPPVIQAYSDLTDQLVEATVGICSKSFGSEQISAFSVMAVGGYGRAEMAPFSDVDLLFLTPPKAEKETYEIIEMILYVLWDLKFKLGHATRSISECVELGKTDQTIKTALMESRHICGPKDLSEKLQSRLWKDLFDSTAPAFVEEKLDERAERHVRHGNQRYLLEPNIKEGKGGLRDLQSMFWITKYISSAKRHSELIEQGYFSEEEYQAFAAAYDFLWATRCHLHLTANRATEKLTFDLQVEVAERMGYKGDDAMRGVEHFMQDYFRHATHVGELTRVFLTALEQRHVKKSISMGDRIRKLWGETSKQYSVDAPFEIKGERISIVTENAFKDDPLNILRLFEVGLSTGLLIHPNAMRMVRANLDLITDEVRANPDAREIFLSLLLDYGDPARALRRMNELGVLGVFIPEFKRIIAMMQFNIYHHFTVDEHIIQCISVLAKVEQDKLLEELPIVSSILNSGVNRRVLYVALLLHDIGKGLPEDHSIAGARLAQEIAPELGLQPKECDTVVWLIENHLLMSDFAQKRDLSDPRTVGNFVKIVKTTNRLNLLTVLTACDIMGVGPGTLNNWKSQLLRDLYFAAKDTIAGGVDVTGRLNSVTAAKEALEVELSFWSEELREAELGRHYDAYWQGLDTDAHVVFANLLKTFEDKKISSKFSIDEDREATRAFFVMEDHPGIFSRIAGALALVKANVIDARTYTSTDGYATPVFWIQDHEGKPFDGKKIERLEEMVNKTLAGNIVAKDALKDHNKLKKSEKPFRVPTEITFDNEGSEIYTIIEVDTRDRASLLFDLTRTLANANIQIASAVIATYGAQAVDVFYVKDMFGLKIHSKVKQDAIVAKLQLAIDQGAEVSMA